MESVDTSDSAQVTEPGPVSLVMAQGSAFPQRSWLSTNLRNLIAIAMTVMVCYLAWAGEQTAQAALVAAFSVLAGAIWGERAALKRPNIDS